ncbi:ABC transporter ATP-binding protein [soil metagenome]
MSGGPTITGELDLPDDLPRPDSSAIVTDRLTKTYAHGNAVDQLSISIQRGEIYGLLGPNGAGKTTTLRMLLGLVRPTSGSALVLDAPPGTTASLRAVGSLVEEPALYPYMSGRDNLRTLARYSGIGRDRIDEVLELVGLLPRAGDKVKAYSLGMRQRLGVAAALLTDPAVLILDEPTNGLDPQGMAAMRELIRDVGTGERTVVLSSHLLAEVEQICDRVGVIREGRLIAEGQVQQLRGARTIRVIAEPVDRAVEVLSAQPEVEAVTVDGAALHVTAPEHLAAALNTALVGQQVTVSHLSVHQRSLEDVFLAMTTTREPQ